MRKSYAPRLINLNGRRMAEFYLDNKKTRLPLNTADDTQAQALVQHLVDAAPRYTVAEKVSSHPRVIAILRKRLDWSKTRAATREMECTVDLDHLVSIYDAQRGRCAVTGMMFDISERQKAEEGRKRPFSPSLDRIDSKGGYTADNTRLVCAAANNAMGSWGEGVFIQLAYALVSHRNRSSGG